MPLTGIWTVEVSGIYGWENRGVLMFCEDKKHVMGGGRNHYSVGSYKKNGKDVKVKLDVYFHDKKQVVFGEKHKNVAVVLTGTYKDNKIRGTVDNPKNSKLSVPLRLTRRADLP